MKISQPEFPTRLYLILDNLLKYSLPVFYFLIAVMFYLRTYDSCQIKITIFQIGGTVMVLLWFLKSLENLKETKEFYFKNWQITLVFVLFLLSGIQSHIFMSPLKKASGMELIRRVIYMLSVLVIMKEIDSIEKFQRMIRWLLAALFISTFYGIIQYLDIKYFPPNPAVGLDPFIWRQAFGSRIFSTFGNPNFYGDFLVTMAPVSLSLFLYKKKIFFLILWIMTLFNTYVTYSKGAWIGFVAGFIYFCFLYIIFFIHTKQQKIRIYVLIASIFAILITTYGVYFQLTQRTDSAKFRIYTWLSCWEMINTSPVLGTGIGTFYVTYPAWRRPQIFYIEGKHNTESDHPENEYLEVLYDEGIVGFGIFLFIITLLVVSSIKALKKFSYGVITIDKKGTKKEITQDIRAFYLLGFLSGWLGSLTHNWVCVSMRFVSSGSIVWMMAGLICSLLINNPLSEKSKQADVLSPLTILFFICMFWFLNFLWWKMTTDVSLAVSVFLFVLGIILETRTLKPLNLATNFSASKKSIVLRITQLASFIVSFYLMNIFRGYFIGDIHHNIAIFYSKQGNWSEALSNYNIVAKNNPGFIMCHYFMGNVFNDRWSLQREYHPEWGDKESDTPFVEIDLGKPGRVDPERSISKYQDVWRLAPNYVQSHHQAGVVYMKLGLHFRNIDIQKSILYFNKALEYFWKYHKIDPIFPVNYQRMASIYLTLGNLEMAEKVLKGHLFTQWLCQNPEDIINPKKIKTEQDKIKYEEIKQRFEEEKNWHCCDYHKREHYLLSTENWARRRSHEYSETYLQLAKLFVGRNNSEAEKFFIRAVKVYPQNFQAWKSLITFYQQFNLNDKIKETIKWYTQEFPQDKELSNLKN